MLKATMIGGAIAISAPVFAQTTQTVPESPVTITPTPAQPVPAAPVQTAPAEVAASEPATGATQIAQVVSTEFPSYDKNADATLDKAEFGTWMVALKTASDPSTKATDPATTKWVSGAFASADTDRSKGVSQAELTKYLSQGAG